MPILTSNEIWAIVLSGKVSLLLICAWGVTKLLHHSSAASRHLIWSLSLAGVLVLPFLSMSLPSMQIPCLSVAPRTAQSTSEPIPHESAPVLSSQPTATQQISPSAFNQPSGEPLQQPEVPTSANSSITQSFSWIPGALFSVWLLGFVTILVQTVVGMVRVASIKKRGSPLPAHIQEIAEQSLAEMGIKRNVNLLLAGNTEDLAVPVTWGILRPTVVLPKQSDGWSETCLRAALLHEFAHVKRHDWAIQLIATLVCAVHWFNPFVWGASKSLRRESENASDNCVLNAGTSPTDYAQSLVDVVKSIPKSANKEHFAVAMVWESEVTQRLKVLLNKNQNRSGLTRKSLLAISLLLGTSVVALATVVLTNRSHTGQVAMNSVDNDTADIAGSPENIKLLGISNSTQNPKIWWDSQGKLLPNAPAGSSQGFASISQTGNKVIKFVIAAYGINSGRSFDIQIPDQTNSYGSTVVALPGDPRSSLELINADFTRSSTSANVKIGTASGPWLLLQSDDNVQSAYSIGSSVKAGAFSVILSSVNTVNDSPALTASYSLSFKAQVRCVAIDRSGKRSVGVETDSGSSNSMSQAMYSFPGLRIGDIKEIQLQYRQWKYVSFNRIPLSPNSQSVSRNGANNFSVTSYIDGKNSAQALVDHGVWLQNHGQPRDGIPDFKQAVALDPNNADAQHALADALMSIRSKTFRTFKNGVPGTSYVSLPAPDVYVAQATNHMTLAVELQPSNAQWHMELGNYLEAETRWADAEQQYREALNLSGPITIVDMTKPVPSGLSNEASLQDGALWCLGDVLVHEHKYAQAVEPLETAIKFNHNDWASLLWLGNALNGSGQRSRAIAAWKQCLTLTPPTDYYGRQASDQLAKYQ